jgi:hypothetical protein
MSLWLSEKKADHVINAHHIIKDGEGLGKYGKTSLGEKITEMKENGWLTDDEWRSMLRLWLAGKLEGYYPRKLELFIPKWWLLTHDGKLINEKDYKIVHLNPNDYGSQLKIETKSGTIISWWLEWSGSVKPIYTNTDRRSLKMNEWEDPQNKNIIVWYVVAKNDNIANVVASHTRTSIQY